MAHSNDPSSVTPSSEARESPADPAANPTPDDLLPQPGRGNEMNPFIPLIPIALVTIAIIVWGALTR